jgi:hypothetical protein
LPNSGVRSRLDAWDPQKTTIPGCGTIRLSDHKEGILGFGDMVDKGKDLVGSNKEAVKGGIDKAADAADKATGGKATDHIDTGAEKAKDIVDDQT